MRHLPGRRRPAAVAAFAALLLTAVTACGGSDDSDDSGASGGSDAAEDAGSSSEPGAFPVTIDGRFGPTTVEEEPERIVTVGLTDQDAVLALGKVPVGTTDWLTLHDAAIGPWAEEALGDADRPELLTDPGTGPQVEAIAALNPDLILAVYAGLTEDQYDSLSQIAPVVTAPEGTQDWGVAWDDQTRIIGAALGQPEAADELVTGVETMLADTREAHPEFADQTGLVATPYDGYYVFGDEDPRSDLLANLGFTIPGELAEVTGQEFGASISRENTDLLDQSALVWLVGDTEGAPRELHDDELYGGLDVVTQGREVYVDESSDLGASLSFGTVLSLPYTVETIVPLLSAAVDGDPATPVVPAS
ncbi:iron-siderophore ABC transporter substrate-binding protein [Streptomyces avicenniae]|uniref:iron-siderophore ABC transporter substrate-binding protein n=1 Tax=Streptomyces avicenniae TaxID=500153 RepID=UPI00069BA0D1|nr:iron-siderophore ABC transporter substrate-binding protein [Streptomyces avicenniae]